jgi:hypothetical protein
MTTDGRDVLNSSGRHAGHTYVQRGKQARCSCGVTVRAPITVTRLSVVLVDGFVTWRGDDLERAAEVAARHEGSYIQDHGLKP